MADLKNFRSKLLLEAMDVMESMDEVVDFDPTEKFIEVLDRLNGDDQRFAESLTQALIQKGVTPERMETIKQVMAETFENNGHADSTEIGQDEDDVFYDPNKKRERTNSSRPNSIQADSKATIRSLSQTKGRDEDQSLYKPTKTTRVRYEEL